MKLKSAFIATLFACVATIGCSSAPKKETAAPAPAAAGCTTDAECTSAGPCGKCVAGACKAVFGPDCCDSDTDCGNPALRCRANKCK
ncbi:MAG: hypothetical protein EXR77_00065 [Myxococcales bacterium]|nr:hypothetical protein [Myxococcales bacterium]